MDSYKPFLSVYFSNWLHCLKDQFTLWLQSFQFHDLFFIWYFIHYYSSCSQSLSWKTSVWYRFHSSLRPLRHSRNSSCSNCFWQHHSLCCCQTIYQNWSAILLAKLEVWFCQSFQSPSTSGSSAGFVSSFGVYCFSFVVHWRSCCAGFYSIVCLKPVVGSLAVMSHCCFCMRSLVVDCLWLMSLFVWRTCPSCCRRSSLDSSYGWILILSLTMAPESSVNSCFVASCSNWRMIAPYFGTSCGRFSGFGCSVVLGDYRCSRSCLGFHSCGTMMIALGLLLASSRRIWAGIALARPRTWVRLPSQ